MAKVLGSWSGMRKYLEKEMLADSLKNRVRYLCSTYVGMDGCGIFTIDVDGKTVKRFSMETMASDAFAGEKPVCMPEYWNGYWDKKNNVPLDDRQEYDDVEFADALKVYRSVDINGALLSSNPLVRMFAILDRRAGKRTLEKLASTVGEQPEWLQFFYKLRMDAEGIYIPK